MPTVTAPLMPSNFRCHWALADQRRQKHTDYGNPRNPTQILPFSSVSLITAEGTSFGTTGAHNTSDNNVETYAINTGTGDASGSQTHPSQNASTTLSQASLLSPSQDSVNKGSGATPPPSPSRRASTNLGHHQPRLPQLQLRHRSLRGTPRHGRLTARHSFRDTDNDGQIDSVVLHLHRWRSSLGSRWHCQWLNHRSRFLALR